MHVTLLKGMAMLLLIFSRQYLADTLNKSFVTITNVLLFGLTSASLGLLAARSFLAK